MSRWMLFSTAAAGVLVVLAVGVPAASAAYGDTIRADAPAGYWALDEAAGAPAAVDASGHGRNGTYFGLLTPGSPGHVGASVRLPGTDDDQLLGGGVSVGTLGGFDASSYSVEAWVSTAYQDNGAIFDRQDGLGFDWSLTVSGTEGRLGQVHYTSNDGCARFNAYGGAIDDGGWHHVVMAEDSTGVTIYVDGIGTRTPFPKVPIGRCSDESRSPSAPLVIGHNLVGSVDEAAAYPSTLTAAQVTAHYNAGGPVAPAEPEADLSSTDRDRAGQLALNDPRISALLSGHVVSVSTVGVWSSNTGARRGAIVTLTWPDAATLQSSWPAITYDETDGTDPPYSQQSFDYSASGVTQLDVVVDLVRGSVVAFEPGRDATVTTPSPITSAPDSDTLGDPSTRHLYPVFLGPDAFFNYDFGHEVINRKDVDMPVTLVFWNQANVSRAKLFGTCTLCGPMHAFLADNNVFNWDVDSGSQNGSVCVGTKLHYRVYSAPGDSMFNTKYGFFVVATSHFDQHDGCGGHSGWSEDAEQRIAGFAAGTFGAAAVRRDVINLENPEGHRVVRGGKVIWVPRRQGSHYMQNDGFATKIKVCVDANGKDTTCP